MPSVLCGNVQSFVAIIMIQAVFHSRSFHGIILIVGTDLFVCLTAVRSAFLKRRDPILKIEHKYTDIDIIH